MSIAMSMPRFANASGTGPSSSGLHSLQPSGAGARGHCAASCAPGPNCVIRRRESTRETLTRRGRLDQDAPRAAVRPPIEHPMVQPKKKRISAKTQRATVKLTPDQLQLIHDRARLRGVKTAVWMRSILLQAAKSQSSAEGGRGYIRIKEPSGETI